MRLQGGIGRWPLIMAALGVVTFGALMSAFGNSLPMHSDAQAYERSTIALEPNLENARDNTATKRFFEVQARYATLRYPLLDAGFTVMAWGGLAAILVFAGQTERVARASRAKIALAVSTLSSLVILWSGLMVWNLLLLERQLLPWWGDSVAIGMFEFTFLLLVVSPFLMGLVIWPAFLKERSSVMLLSGPLLHLGGLVYLALAALFLFFAVRSAVMGGGYAISIGSGIMAWLLLNARALMFASKGAA